MLPNSLRVEIQRGLSLAVMGCGAICKRSAVVSVLSRAVSQDVEVILTPKDAANNAPNPAYRKMLLASV
jgi:hypothetical protein